MRIVTLVALGVSGFFTPAAPAQQTAPLVKRDVVVRVTAYSGTEALDEGNDYQPTADAKETPQLQEYIESQIESWGFITESQQHGQTSACMVVNGKCDSVGPPRDFDWSHAKNVDVDVYVRYKGASSTPSAVDIDFRNGDQSSMFGNHWRTHVNVRNWDKSLQTALDRLHKQMGSGK
jgi:hypothetical protein